MIKEQFILKNELTADFICERHLLEGCITFETYFPPNLGMNWKAIFKGPVPTFVIS